MDDLMTKGSPLRLKDRLLSRYWLGFAGSGLMLIVALLAIWAPPVAHFYVRTPSINAETIEALRNVPSDERLNELTERHLMFQLGKEEERVAAADRVRFCLRSILLSLWLLGSILLALFFKELVNFLARIA